jgi:predicted NAD/FAD-dependent oxidoreductase
VRVVVVGAGLAGLAAARDLVERGHEVIVFDKGRGPGGRMATRRIGTATLDHGAQFFTVRTATLARLVEGWESAGVVHEWCRGFADQPDGHARYAAVGGMNALAKHLAVGLDVRCQALVFSLARGRSKAWQVMLDDATTVEADAVLMATPVPQALAVVITSGVELPDDLRAIDYDRTLALMVVLDGAPGRWATTTGAVQHGDDTFSMIVDNVRKGISAAPAVTFHANASWSLEWWDRDRRATAGALLVAAEPWLGGARVVEHQVKRWRFATPRTIWPDPCWVAPGMAPLVLAGDAFAGPRIEGAVLSGLAAAAAIDAAGVDDSGDG